MTKGLSFDQLYPGTYIKAGEFGGKAVTLTIKDVKREMLSNGTGGEEGAVTVSFDETEKQWVMNKTCGVCLRAMWGDDSGEWAGHRVTLHPVKDESGLSESGQCIRVKGSPELPKELKFRARLGRKMVTQTLVPTGKGSPSGGSSPAFDEGTGEVFDAEAAPATETGLEGDDSAWGDAGAADAFSGPGDAEEPEDDDVPGRGPLTDKDDPDRAPTNAEKKRLSEALGELDDVGAVKTFRARYGGRSNSDLTKGEIDEFTAWAREQAAAS